MSSVFFSLRGGVLRVMVLGRERVACFGLEPFFHEQFEAFTVFDSFFDGLELSVRDIGGGVFALMRSLEDVVGFLLSVFERSSQG